MRTWVIILAITTAAFAGSTVYLARELASERAQSANADSPRPPATPPVAALPGLSPVKAEADKTEPPATAPIGAVTTVNRARQMTEAEVRNAQAEYARNLLARLADPQSREEFLMEQKSLLRHSYPRIENALGLAPEEHARFLELQALQIMDLHEMSSRCLVDPQCRTEDLFRGQQDTRGQEIASLLGPERARKFETYKNTLSERESVSQLRSRLPDAQRLGDDNAERLILALAQEREAIYREAANGGRDLHGFGFGAGMVFSPADDQSLEQRMETARLSSQRLRDRAASYLNGEQLRAFNEMQDEALIALRGMLRNKDSGFSAATVTGAD